MDVWAHELRGTIAATESAVGGCARRLLSGGLIATSVKAAPTTAPIFGRQRVPGVAREMSALAAAKRGTVSRRGASCVDELLSTGQ